MDLLNSMAIGYSTVYKLNSKTTARKLQTRPTRNTMYGWTDGILEDSNEQGHDASEARFLTIDRAAGSLVSFIVEMARTDD